jgi:hypothetical protein
MRTALFWVIKRPVVVIPYRRFGTNCVPSWILDPWSWDREVVPKRRQEISTTYCVINKGSSVLTCCFDFELFLPFRPSSHKYDIGHVNLSLHIHLWVHGCWICEMNIRVCVCIRLTKHLCVSKLPKSQPFKLIREVTPRYAGLFCLLLCMCVNLGSWHWWRNVGQVWSRRIERRIRVATSSLSHTCGAAVVIRFTFSTLCSPLTPVTTFWMEHPHCPRR